MANAPTFFHVSSFSTSIAQRDHDRNVSSMTTATIGTNLRKEFGTAMRFQLSTVSLVALFIGCKHGLFSGAIPVKNNRNGGLELISARRRADWLQQKELPYFCQELIARPKPFNKTCHRHAVNMTCMNFNGEAQMFSQFQQDYYLYTRHFKMLKRMGVYVDIAANEPVGISNTYFFDRCLRWKGVCVEGNPTYFERIHRLRSCHLVPTCVGTKEGEFVEFGLNGGAGGVLGNSYKSMKRLIESNVTISTLTERCTTMKTVLQRESIFEIDYLSLDVEGHELQVLKGFDWPNVKINVMTIEVSGTALQNIEDFLVPQGYTRHMAALPAVSGKDKGLLQEDAIFLHKDVTFGSPQ